MSEKPAAGKRTGVDDSRDRGREALKRIGAIRDNQTLKPWQEAAVVAIGDLEQEKDKSVRGRLDFVLVEAVTEAIDDHTKKMTYLTGALVLATLALLLTPFVDNCARKHEEARPKASAVPAAPSPLPTK